VNTLDTGDDASSATPAVPTVGDPAPAASGAAVAPPASDAVARDARPAADPPVDIAPPVPSATPDPAPPEPSTAGPGVLNPDVRRRLIDRFETWVDRMALGEPPPAGVPNELLVEASSLDAPGGDLYSVFAGLTNLSGEVRLQGRAFKVLADGLAPLSELPGRVDQLVDALATDESADDPAATLPKPTAMIEVLLDLYDRLARGLRNAEAAVEPDDEATAAPPPPGLFDRLLGRSHPAPPADGSADAVRAMRDGYALTLSRLTAALHQWDVEPIGRAGEPFDPRRMVAIDVRPAGDQPPGTVLEVNRSGSAVRGAVLTPAQVTVAR
jgi:hypothetical protein